MRVFDAHSLQNHDHKLSDQPHSFTGPPCGPCPQFEPVTTLVLAHCLERSSLSFWSWRYMLHFLLLPLLLSAWYERPGSPARASHALCVSEHTNIARAIIPRPQLLGRLSVGCACLYQQHGGQEHCCRACNPPSVNTSSALHPAFCARQANQSCTLAHHCFTKIPLCHWSSDSASTNITDAQPQVLNAPPLVKVLQLLS